MRILVVDDDPDVTLVLGGALRERGHLVAVASTGAEAIERAAAFQPDAALVDVGLPDIDGVTLAELLRGAVQGKSLRIVGLSGYPERRLERAITRDLFDDFLVKPTPFATIERALRGTRRPDSSIVWPRSHRRRPASA